MIRNETKIWMEKQAEKQAELIDTIEFDIEEHKKNIHYLTNKLEDLEYDLEQAKTVLKDLESLAP